MTAKIPLPVTLTGHHVRLEPLKMEHLGELFAAGGGDDEVWRWQGGPTPHTQDDLGLKLVAMLEAAEQGKYIPFVVIHRATDQAVGWTAFMDIDAHNERLEVGWTWSRCMATTVWATRSATVGTPKILVPPPCGFGISTAFTGGGK
jgi:RimJ/RimL family protein N-acetyltransferase